MLFFFHLMLCTTVHALSCYQCSMKYSNDECNTNTSSYFMECQPTYDTCTTIVLKPALFDQIIITKFCSKKKACELQQTYTHSLTPCRPNNQGRSWGCVSCCSDRDLCNVNETNSIRIDCNYFLLLGFIFFLSKNNM